MCKCKNQCGACENKKQEKEFSLEQLIQFGYFVRKSTKKPMREIYLEWKNHKKTSTGETPAEEEMNKPK